MSKKVMRRDPAGEVTFEKKRHHYWPLQMGLIGVFCLFLWVDWMGHRGQLSSTFFRDAVYPNIVSFEGVFTNLKFHMRGKQEPKNDIVIVAVDNPSLEALGRWPWDRNMMAYLLSKINEKNPKALALDIVFSEEAFEIPLQLQNELKKRNLTSLLAPYNQDEQLAAQILENQDRMVLGWATENPCTPATSKQGLCPVTDPNLLKEMRRRKGQFNFALKNVKYPKNFDPQRLGIPSVPKFISNLPLINLSAMYSGTVDIKPDPDGYVRRAHLIYFADGKAFSSLPLTIASVVRGEEIDLTLNSKHLIESLKWKRTGDEIPVGPTGEYLINFRGKSRTFTYVSALDMMQDEEEITVIQDRKPAKVTKDHLLKNAIVLVGVTASAVYDIRAFPFDPVSPGVEGHASVLDNILSNDPLLPTSAYGGYFVLLLLMLVGAIVLSYFMEELEPIPAMGLFTGVFFVIFSLDQWLLFAHSINWNTSLVYSEYGVISIATLSARYIEAIKNKKFLRSAFNKYLSPHVVDVIIKDPTKLQLGGHKEEVSILFSDIRSFTTFSEGMDPKKLSEFLNEYLSEMTEVVLETDGTLDKYIGDAVMAFWGAPIHFKEHASHAAFAAIKMTQIIRRERQKFIDKYGVDLQVGIGINTGEVTAGNLGSESNFDYTIIGDHVNLAARLEGLTKFYQVGVIATNHTIRSIEETGEKLPHHRTIDLVKVKGKKKAVEIVQLLDDEFSEEGLEVFNKAREIYLKREFAAARVEFKKSEVLLAGTSAEEWDVPSRIYVERCEKYLKDAPEDDWDGSWAMTRK